MGHQTKYGRWRQPPQIPTIPSPFCSFLLASAWYFDFEDPSRPYISDGIFENADIASSEGDNDDGITIIDITDPQNAAYCFVSIHNLGGRRDVKTMTPLSAMDYLRTYYPVPDAVAMVDDGIRAQEEDSLKIISSLDGEPLVTGEMLADAWPSEYRSFLQQDDKQTNAPPTIDEPTSISSLMDLSFKLAIKSALQNDATEEIESLIWLPGKAEAAIAELKTYNPFPDSGITLLAKLIRQGADEPVLDLSHLFLSTEQIVTLLTDFEGTEILKLSHNPLVTIDTVPAVLNAVPDIRRLVLFNTAIPSEDLAHLMLVNKELFFRLEALIHPLLYTGEVAYPNAFTFLQVYGRDVSYASLPLFTPAQIVQCLTDFLLTYLGHPYHDVNIYTLPAIFSTTVRKKEQSWNERTVPFFPQVFECVPKDEGWCFAFDPTYNSGAPGHQYAFVKISPATPGEKKKNDPVGVVAQAGAQTRVQEPLAVDRKTPSYKPYDLHSWLAEMEREGRPSVPMAAVEALAAILDRLYKELGFTLMKPKNIDDFMVYYNQVLRFQRFIGGA